MPATDAVQPIEPPTAEALAPASREALERLRAMNPKADPVRYLPGVDPARLPRHVAIIMDGNGRWAGKRGFPREFGHRNGASAVREALSMSGRLGIECLTLYSFSADNWRRPTREVGELMRLYMDYMDAARQKLVEENIRFRQIGSREGMPAEAIEALERTLEATAGCTGPILCLAVNYGSRAEIARAARELAGRVARGEMGPEGIDEASLGATLDTAGLPELDLLIRTGGEMRLSNFLLWEASYAELYVTETLWPDFTGESLIEAVRAYAARERRFGGVTQPGAES